MALKEYELPDGSTYLLDEEEAKERGGKPVTKARGSAANKARGSAANKTAAED